MQISLVRSSCKSTAVNQTGTDRRKKYLQHSDNYQSPAENAGLWQLLQSNLFDGAAFRLTCNALVKE